MTSLFRLDYLFNHQCDLNCAKLFFAISQIGFKYFFLKSHFGILFLQRRSIIFILVLRDLYFVNTISSSVEPYSQLNSFNHYPSWPSSSQPHSERLLLIAKSIEKSFCLDPDNTMVDTPLRSILAFGIVWSHERRPVGNRKTQILWNWKLIGSWPLLFPRRVLLSLSISFKLASVHQGNRAICSNPRFKNRELWVYESMNGLYSEHGIDRDIIMYLVGDLSYYKENQTSTHEMSLPSVGAAISNYFRRSKHGRQRTYRLVWKLLIGYDHFDAGNKDRRWIESYGVIMSSGPEDDKEDQVPYNEKIMFGSIMI